MTRWVPPIYCGMNSRKLAIGASARKHCLKSALLSEYNATMILKSLAGAISMRLLITRRRYLGRTVVSCHSERGHAQKPMVFPVASVYAATR